MQKYFNITENLLEIPQAFQYNIKSYKAERESNTRLSFLCKDREEKFKNKSYNKKANLCQ